MKHNDKSSKKIMVINGLLIAAAAGFILWAVVTYFGLGKGLYTNDAQIEEYINPINTRVAGYIKEVRFTDHQVVKKGDTLVWIDDSEFKIQVEQAEAAFMAAQASRTVTTSNFSTVQSGLSISDANISALQARLWNAEQNFNRYKNLLDEGAATQQQFDQVKSEYEALLFQTKAQQQQRNATNLAAVETSKKVTVNDAEIKRTHALLELAKLNLSYTVITAPYDGVTGRRIVQEGQLLQAGQTLMSYVRNDGAWVIANYKETQIAHLKVGQHVRLRVDGFSNTELDGKIAAISQATGSRFSAIPTDNSTGNFIKVQQRIPVRIEFVKSRTTDELLQQVRAGMNVEVRVVN